ncbi:hypothetical protein AN6050.2 [Aspergillus nidulans FGSC A4]|uniref:DUF7708 domain-containing protein n=1 Tax=Emericella nidulans (strain FGSC A4 / ATCC 38163 / CBS 112.46 / NRRL 194 / M139) TaxID=227321 RepID=Q5B080_EMENI|nr:hypothetical protein [Aspergillus nidulans FGSC A4]EAA58025.1 hypothetical protein AN6050.2 [Aspergillus nidulans FGSC A4]CBF70286.1 TPA: conserved hypothetical protein [Aspergillus nidulans FGSC A4]|eukprot:XP_663654.1 hypothetical protein AN6050.2 [Aspergillus nidulans FGSC A4]
MSVQVVSDPLAVSLTTEDRQFSATYWKKRFDVRPPSPHPAIATLDIEYSELAKAWKRLQEILPLSEQVLFEERPQTLQDVQVLIRDVQAYWVSSPRQRLFSRSMALCDTFLATSGSHALPLKALPSHQYYSSLLYGTLQTIIKASSKYPRVVNGVLEALVNVNRSIYLPESGEPLQITNDSIPALANFYSHLFFFLGELMDWYARRFKCRLLQSLHEDIYSDFRNLILTVQSSARGFTHAFVDAPSLNDSGCDETDTVMQHADLYLWENARLSQLGRRNIERRFAAQNAMTRLLIWEIQHSADQRAQLRDERGQLLVQMFDMASKQLRSNGHQHGAMVRLTTAAGQDSLNNITLAEKQKHKYTRVELQLGSAHLQDYFDIDDQLASYEPTDVMVEEDVLDALKQWSTETYPQILTLGSVPESACASPVALVSACYTNLARNANSPVIAYSCSVPPTAKDGMTLFQQGLIALVYSLIRQLLEYLPPVVNGSSTHIVKAENFALLDGTLASWQEVLSLVDTLLYYAPPLLLCVVDGLDRLQDQSTDQYIRSLVRIFVSHTRQSSDSTPGQQNVLLKVLFTVTGRLAPLMETLSENPLTLKESSATERSTLNPPSCSDNDVPMGE